MPSYPGSRSMTLNGTTSRPENRCRMALLKASTAACVTSASTSTCSPTLGEARQIIEEWRINYPWHGHQMERGSLTICGRSARPNKQRGSLLRPRRMVDRQAAGCRLERRRSVAEVAPTNSSTRLELFAVHSESSVVSKMTESNLPSRQFR
jgi:hypothetical protein